MRRNGNPEDAAYVKDARNRLGMSQPVFAAALGMSQSGVSHVENQWTPLADVDRETVERLLARYAALEILNDRGGWRNGVARCAEGKRLVEDDAGAFFAHLEQCPTCLARAALVVA